MKELLLGMKLAESPLLSKALSKRIPKVKESEPAFNMKSGNMSHRRTKRKSSYQRVPVEPNATQPSANDLASTRAKELSDISPPDFISQCLPPRLSFAQLW
jgi:hypothetical protein